MMIPLLHKKNLTKKQLKLVFNLAILSVLLVAFGVGMLLVQRQQDLRQQAATTNPATSLLITPQSASFQLNQQATINLVAKVESGKQISGVQYVIDVIGNLPNDFTFTRANIPNLEVTEQIDDISNGKRVSIVYHTTPPNFYVPNTNDLVVGTIRFTPSQTGTVQVVPIASLTKIVEHGTTQNLLSGVAAGSYSFVTPTNTPSPTPTNTPTPTVTNTATPTITLSPTPSNTSTPSVTATNTPTPTNTATATPTSTVTLTNTPTPTSTPVPTATFTPVPTASFTPVPTSTFTPTPTPIPTATFTPVPTATYTSTPEPTATFTVTPTGTNTLTPTPTTTYLASDINKDGVVNLFDYSILSRQFLQEGENLAADINKDGVVNLFDYSLLVNDFSFL